MSAPSLNSRVALTLVWPAALGACLLLLLSPYSRSEAKFIFYCMVVLWFAAVSLDYRRHLEVFSRSAPWLNRAFAGLACACALALFASVDFYHSQQVFVSRYLMYFASYCLGFWIVSANGRRRVLAQWLCLCFVVGGLVFALGCIRDYLVYRPARLFTVFGHEIPFAMLPLFLTYYLVLVFSCCLFAPAARLRRVSWCVFALLLPCVLWQGSRTAWVAGAAGLALLALLRGKRWFMGVCCAIACCALLGLAQPGIRFKLSTIPHPQQWNYRTPLYDSALKIFRDHPITGAGIGMFEILIKQPAYQLPATYPGHDRDLYLHAHSFYLETLAEMGIPGVFAFLVFFTVFLGLCWLYKPAADPAGGWSRAVVLAAAGMLSVALVSGVTGSLIIVGVNEALMLWLVIGCAAGLLSVSKEHQDLTTERSEGNG